MFSNKRNVLFLLESVKINKQGKALSNAGLHIKGSESHYRQAYLSDLKNGIVTNKEHKLLMKQII